ncbi:MAG: hypothetical protein HC912_05390 [Saprospiraceae bacterium]|nr:hypothetical protein [Saprospiraceae bacterium]
MESKTINKTVNLTANPSTDFAEIQALLSDGWKVKEIHANVENVGDKKHLVYHFYSDEVVLLFVSQGYFPYFFKVHSLPECFALFILFGKQL